MGGGGGGIWSLLRCYLETLTHTIRVQIFEKKNNKKQKKKTSILLPTDVSNIVG